MAHSQLGSGVGRPVRTPLCGSAGAPLPLAVIWRLLFSGRRAVNSGACSKSRMSWFDLPFARLPCSTVLNIEKHYFWPERQQGGVNLPGSVHLVRGVHCKFVLIVNHPSAEKPWAGLRIPENQKMVAQVYTVSVKNATDSHP